MDDREILRLFDKLEARIERLQKPSSVAHIIANEAVTISDDGITVIAPIYDLQTTANYIGWKYAGDLVGDVFGWYDDDNGEAQMWVVAELRAAESPPWTNCQVVLAAVDEDAGTDVRLYVNANETITAAADKFVAQGTVKIGGLAADPAGENGMMYYNTATHKFRGYANGGWVDLH